jgi:hypothetical protein
MTTQNDVFANFTNFQKEALEPIRAANGVAAETFERLTRQNYEIHVIDAHDFNNVIYKGKNPHPY